MSACSAMGIPVFLLSAQVTGLTLIVLKVVVRSSRLGLTWPDGR